MKGNKVGNDLHKNNETGLSILTLNLRTYQEKDQEDKFNEIVEFIDSEDVDIVCFQECAQHKDGNFIPGSKRIREDNMAYIISNKLSHKGKRYYYCWDWAHYGWNVWEEGIAILSKCPFMLTESGYVSESKSKTDLMGSRKAIFAQTYIPDIGRLNVFSVHLSWESAGLLTQISNLVSFVERKEGEDVIATVVCGDFNDEPTGRGYRAMIDAGFVDSYFLANPDGFTGKTTNWGKRIDYIFFKGKNESLTVFESKVVFTGKRFKTVSDHYGVLTKFIKSK